MSPPSEVSVSGHASKCTGPGFPARMILCFDGMVCWRRVSILCEVINDDDLPAVISTSRWGPADLPEYTVDLN
jgi:hypothetical protein